MRMHEPEAILLASSKDSVTFLNKKKRTSLFSEIMSKMVKLISYQNEKSSPDKKCVFYKGPSSITIIVSFRVTFDKFMDKLYIR